MRMGIVVVASFAARVAGSVRGYDDIHVETDQFGREAGEPVELSLGVPEVDREVLALDVAELAQSPLKSLIERRDPGGRGRQHTDPPHPSLLLRLGGERRGEEPTN